MKKIFYLSLLFFSLNSFSQTTPQGIKILLEERSKHGTIPMPDTKADLVINDTLKRTLTSDKDGYLALIEIPPGKYNLKVSTDGCETIEQKDIIVVRQKSAQVTIGFICVYEEEPKKKKKRD